MNPNDQQPQQPQYQPTQPTEPPQPDPQAQQMSQPMQPQQVAVPQPVVETQPVAPAAQQVPNVYGAQQYAQPTPQQAPVTADFGPSVAMPMGQQQPVMNPAQMTDPYAAAPASTRGGLVGMLDEKAGMLSLAVFLAMFVLLSIASLIEINKVHTSVVNVYELFGGELSAPSLFSMTKDAVTHWQFVNVISAGWWIVGLLPGLALAGYSLWKKGVRGNIPAIVTTVLTLVVLINIIVK